MSSIFQDYHKDLMVSFGPLEVNLVQYGLSQFIQMTDQPPAPTREDI